MTTWQPRTYWWVAVQWSRIKLQPIFCEPWDFAGSMEMATHLPGVQEAHPLPEHRVMHPGPWSGSQGSCWSPRCCPVRLIATAGVWHLQQCTWRAQWKWRPTSQDPGGLTLTWNKGKAPRPPKQWRSHMGGCNFPLSNWQWQWASPVSFTGHHLYFWIDKKLLNKPVSWQYISSLAQIAAL